MSQFVDVEWFGRDHKIGIALTYDKYDGFKVRMAPIPQFAYQEPDEEQDIRYLMDYAAKIPFEWAWGIFGERMKATWQDKHLPDYSCPTIQYDNRYYDVGTLKEVK